MVKGKIIDLTGVLNRLLTKKNGPYKEEPFANLPKPIKTTSVMRDVGILNSLTIDEYQNFISYSLVFNEMQK